MKLKEYLNASFPGLILKPSLFYQWDIGLHFELAQGLYQFKNNSDDLNPEYFKRVYNESLSIFNDLFLPDDKMLLVTNFYQYKEYSLRRTKKIKVYNRYIKNKNLIFHLHQNTLPYMFSDDEDADKYCTSQFSLSCFKQDIRNHLLIKAACNEDFPSLKPRLNNKCGLDYPDLFFINTTKNVIFFIYDDRGCEVIANNKETLRPIYEKYNDLIDEYCRNKIKKLFS